MRTADSAAAQDLERLLDRIHGALLRGDLESVGMIGPEIATRVTELPALADVALARRLQDKARRNAACLEAAARGVRAARRRFAEITRARSGLVTYDGKGRSSTLAGDAGQLIRRF